MNPSMQQHQEFIPVDAINATLAMEWANITTEIQEVTGTPPLRTQILTLVVIARGTDETSRAHQLIHQLRESSPSRVILLQIGGEVSQPAARAWVHCNLNQGEVDHSYDVIEVDLSETNADAAPNLISSHKLSDVPVLVYWLGHIDLSSKLFRQVSSVANRIVIDTSTFDQPLEALSQFAHFLDAGGEACTGSDLAWRRLHVWRELVAQSFDDVDDARLFSLIRQIEISHGPGYRAEAMLLAGWLAATLNWRPEAVQVDGPTTCLTGVSPAGAACRVTLFEAAGTGIGLRSLRIVAPSDEETTRVVIRHSSGSRSTISIDATGLPRLERTVPHTEPSLIELLSEELLMVKREPTYEAALRLASEFARILLINGSVEHG